MVKTAGEAAIDAAREPREGNDLAAVGVAGELQADARLFHDGQAGGRVVEEDAGLGGARVGIVGRSSCGFMCSGEGVVIEHAGDPEAVNDNLHWRGRGCRRA